MPQTFDPVTTQKMLSAYDDAQALYTNAITTVDHLTDESKVYWKGAAGDTYRGELAGWSSGVGCGSFQGRKIRSVLGVEWRG